MNRPASSNQYAHEFPMILAEIRSRDWPRQNAAIQVLSDIESPGSDLMLLGLLDNRSPDVREAAMTALLMRDIAAARLAARAGLSDDNSCVRTRAAEALATIGTRLDIRRLKSTLRDDSDWVVRASAADGLGQVAKKAARRPLLRAVLDDPHPVVRRDAAFALSYTDDPSVMPDIESALAAEVDEQARIGLLSGLYALGQKEHLPDLLLLLQSIDDQVRHATINAVEYIIRQEDHDIAIEALQAMVETEQNPGVREDAKRVIATMRAAQVQDIDATTITNDER